jgi:hypothetical protein
VSVPSQSVAGTVMLLRSNGLSSAAQPTLGGQSLSTNTGQLTGTTTLTTVKPSGHTYQLHLPATSAAILSFASPNFKSLRR